MAAGQHSVYIPDKAVRDMQPAPSIRWARHETEELTQAGGFILSTWCHILHFVSHWLVLDLSLKLLGCKQSLLRRPVWQLTYLALTKRSHCLVLKFHIKTSSAAVPACNDTSL
jgi:hypothetical protein